MLFKCWRGSVKGGPARNCWRARPGRGPRRLRRGERRLQRPLAGPAPAGAGFPVDRTPGRRPVGSGSSGRWGGGGNPPGVPSRRGFGGTMAVFGRCARVRGRSGRCYLLLRSVPDGRFDAGARETGYRAREGRGELSTGVPKAHREQIEGLIGRKHWRWAVFWGRYGRGAGRRVIHKLSTGETVDKRAFEWAGLWASWN